ncbi:DNA internalization-related competence protein ComEC/Rec2 [Halobacillus seohaensis]|uniref:DNA internalization-related competence protein ComEC/Rec2 n=2 Tax=Halobacillus seohaensis TaxID=447421 RepID=A0ABW2EGR8_9BACI
MLSLIFLCIFLFWAKFSFNSWKWKGVLGSFFAFGFILFSPQHPPPSYPSQTELLTGKISAPITETTAYLRTTLSRENSKNKAIIQYYKDEPIDPLASELRTQLKYGAFCEIKGKVSRPEGARNPGQFDYRQYLEQQNIYHEVLITSPDQLSCQGASVFDSIYQLRANIMASVDKTLGDEPYSWATALVFGDSSLLPEEIMKWFRDFSLSHILAISGLHVGLFIGGIFFLLYRSSLTTIEQARWFLLIIIPCYCFIAGAEPSVLRAGLMACLIILMVQSKLRINITDVISLVALFLLILSPMYLFNLGFQFSFLVSFSLILSAPILQNKNPWVISATISLVSQLSILPIQLYHFYQYNPLSLIANLILIPYFSFIVIPLLFLIVLLCFVLPAFATAISSIFITVHNKLLDVLISNSAELNLQWVVGKISIEWICVYLVIFTLFMKNWSVFKLRRAFSYAVLMIGLLMVYCLQPYFSDQGTVTMLDVGQGDAFVIELPYRRGVLMIDAAGSPIFSENSSRVAEQIIEPFLKSKGISHLDALIISHKDQDHSGSIEPLLSSFSVGKLYVSSFYEQELGLEEVIRSGETIMVANTEFHIIHPEEDYSSPNDNSLVVYSQFGGMSWLFTGDI